MKKNRPISKNLMAIGFSVWHGLGDTSIVRANLLSWHGSFMGRKWEKNLESYYIILVLDFMERKK